MLAHIGACTAHGFRIEIPYLVKDMADMMDDLNQPTVPDHNTLPGSVNMDYTADDDEEILAITKDYCYWWKYPPGSEVETPRVTRNIISRHFLDFYKVVSKFLHF